MHKFGLPFLREALDRIEAAAIHHNNAQILNEVGTVRQNMLEAAAKLGGQSDLFGIERRGAETHISLNPAGNTVRPLGGRLQGPAAQQFTQDAVRLSNDEGITTPGMTGSVCHQAEVDWPRSTLHIAGQTFNHAALGPTAQQLLALTQGDAQMAMLVSQYANQQTLGALTDALMRGDLDVRAPGGPQGMPLGAGRTEFDIQADPAGGIRLGVRYTQLQVTQLQTVDANGLSQATATDPAQSHTDFSFALTIAPDYSVRVSQELHYEAMIRTG